MSYHHGTWNAWHYSMSKCLYLFLCDSVTMTVTQWLFYSVTRWLSDCYSVTVTFVTRLLSDSVTLTHWPCDSVTVTLLLLLCYLLILLHCDSVTQWLSYSVILLLCYAYSVTQCFSDCDSVTLLLCDSATQWLCCVVALSLCDTVTLWFWLCRHILVNIITQEQIHSRNFILTS